MNVEPGAAIGLGMMLTGALMVAYYLGRLHGLEFARKAMEAARDDQ